VQAIRALEEGGRLERLPPPLREVAELRLRHPSVSLRELAAKCRPPVTKAAAHRRLGRLISLAGKDLQQL
jgi:DNA-binding transcriptional regulator WhiA